MDAPADADVIIKYYDIDRFSFSFRYGAPQCDTASGRFAKNTCLKRFFKGDNGARVDDVGFLIESSKYIVSEVFVDKWKLYLRIIPTDFETLLATCEVKPA